MLVPGLRFQILLVLLGVAMLSTVLSAMVAMAALDAIGGAGGARRLLVVFFGLNFAVLVLFGGWVLIRGVVRPVERLAGQVERVARLEFGGLDEGHQLGQLGTSFRQMLVALSEERERVRRQIAELEEANRSLTEAQESLVRSEKLATVGRLSAGLAHEVGNPLGGLIGYLELLKSRIVEGTEHRELVMGALEAAERIDRIIRDLLDFSRPHSFQAAPVDLAAAVDAAVQLVVPRQRFSAVEVDLRLPDGLPQVFGDHGSLTQVLVNLFINAADAMHGDGRLTVTCDQSPDDVCVHVIDDGPGLPEGDPDEIFEPFYTTKDPGQGTGLGLAISRRIVESWGGRLEARSREDGGAIFSIWLRGADSQQRPEG
jgi:two-component system, NtrC family, sensor kinase